MVKIFTLLFFPLICFSYSIVFVHIGDGIPSFLLYTISQARVFNDCPIYLITNQKNKIRCADEFCALENINVTFVACESLVPSDPHRVFKDNRFHDWGTQGFWVYTSERFFYLEELMTKLDLEDVFHLENDVLLYENLENLLPVMKKNYENMIAATFEADTRCVPSFMYISNSKPIQVLVRHFNGTANINNTDMEVLAKFKDNYRNVWIDFLPIIVPEYFLSHNYDAKKAKDVTNYYNNLDQFDSIFDAAALGIYLAGWDSRYHAECHPGTVTSLCVFNSSHVKILWEVDCFSRKVPYMEYGGKKWKINNLHLTNKSRIYDFLSTN